jgi:Na+-translocating ferredoxin:NAD+ oxidoreductase RnfC subunit
MRANDLKRVVKVFRCESCDVVCTGPFPLDQHQRAAKHGPYALRKLQKNDEEIAALL